MTKNYPSKEYYKNLKYYKDMHKNGYHLIDGRKRDPKDAYDGKSTLAYAEIIKKIIKNENIVNMIDTISMLKDILDAKKHGHNINELNVGGGLGI